MKTTEAVSGSHLKILFAERESGGTSVAARYAALDRADRAAIYASMKRLAATGRIYNEQKFKKLEGTELWEFKQRGHRFLGFYLPKGRFIVAVYEDKKQRRLRPGTIERANLIKQQMEKEEVTVNAGQGTTRSPAS